MTITGNDRSAAAIAVAKDSAGNDSRSIVLPSDHQHVAQNAAASGKDWLNERPAEHGGQAGPEPTRYGDWEKKGRCTDF